MALSFEDNSKQIKSRLAKVSNKALEAALLAVEAQAKALAPVDSGELRDKIDHHTTTQNGERVGQVGSPLMYSLYVEFGTGEFAENGAGRKGGWVFCGPDGKFYHTIGAKPQPFIRPAFRRTKKNVESIIGVTLGEMSK